MRFFAALLAIFLCSASLSGSEKVVLQLQWLPQFQFAGYYMAKEKGFYKNAGLDVDIRPTQSGLNVEAEVLSGRAQYGTGRSSLLVAYEEGQPIVALAAIFQSSPMMLLVRKDAGIESVGDLRGRRVMLTDDVQNAASIQAMLRSEGLTEEDMVVQPHSFDYGSLERNETDAMAAYVSNEPYLLKQHGVETFALDPKAYGFDFYSDILFTSKKELAEHPDRVRRFYDATMQGWRYAFNHIEETARILYNRYNPQGKHLDALIYEGETLRPLAILQGVPLGHLDQEKLRAIVQAYRLLGLCENGRAPAAFVYHPDRLTLTPEESAWIKAHPVIRIGVDPAWPPVEFLGKDGSFSGITSGYLELIAQKLGLRVELVPFATWEEVEQALKVRRIDLASGMMDIPQRRKYARFTSAFLSIPMVIIGGEALQYAGDLAALGNKRIAVVSGYAADVLLQRDHPEIDLIHTDHLEDALVSVAYGKADAAVDGLAVASYLIAQKQLSNLRIVGQTPYSYEIAMGIRSDWPELRKLLQKALDTISDTERAAIYEQWVPTVFERKPDYALVKKGLMVLALLALLFGFKYFQLENLVKRRTRELEELNNGLHEKIEYAVEENQKKERMMIQQAKMATIGEMIESIAHQWRQPLNIMGIGISNLDLKRQLGSLEQEELDALIEMVQQQVAYMSQTIDDFRNFFKKDKALERVPLRPLVEEVAALVAPALRQKKIVLDSLVPDGLESDLYPNELKQVVLNLVSNAKDALSASEVTEKKIVIRAASDTEWIRLEVEDNGGGIPDAIMEKIFEPYYTTKFESQGTGIGLYMSKMIMERNLKGKIEVRNKDEGACFTLSWPKRVAIS